jgi:NTE family protein
MKVLFLSSGAAHGAFQAGALQAIEESGWEPDIVLGVSVGAINGTGWVSGLPAHDLCAMWDQIGTKDVYRMRPVRDWFRPWTWTHLVDTTPLERFLEARIDFLDVYDSDKLMAITGLDIRTGRSRLFCSKITPKMEKTLSPSYDLSLLNMDALMASGAIPGIFPWRGEVWDGAFAQQQPLKAALLLGATEICVVHMHVPYEDAPIPTSPFETVWRLAELATTFPLMKDLRLFQQRNEDPNFRTVKLNVICPEHPLGYSKINFASKLKGRAVEHGYEVATQKMEGWGSKKSKILTFPGG